MADRDCGSCSVDEETTQKMIGKRYAPLRDLKDPNPRGVDRAPPSQLAYGVRGHLGVQMARVCAKAALSSMNKQNQATKQPKYELVEALDCIVFHYPWIYHCNFIARPKNGSEAENKLFFAEVKSETKKTGTRERTVNSCPFYCILGPSDSKTGLSGCKSCDRHPGCIVHPEHGGFTSDDRREWALWLQKRDDDKA